jgi:DNA repair protein RadA/Sms
MSLPLATVGTMARVKTLLACTECGQPASQWAGRCPGCGGWGTIAEQPRVERSFSSSGPAIVDLAASEAPDRRVSTAFSGIDRVLGGGLVPASVVLLAGEPGIGKSTLLLQLAANLSTAGLTCLLASGEESRDQVAARAQRLGARANQLSFTSGRDLSDVLEAARSLRPFLLAVDSIQTLRDVESSTTTGGPTQVRGCTDALVGLAKSAGITVLITGHVTKDGDLAGPRTLEHAVDVVLTFDGDPRSGLRTLAGGKNRFGPDGEIAWFEMGSAGLAETDPSRYLMGGDGQAGSAIALPVAGRRALAVEVQALVAPTDGPPRRHAAGFDPRRFALVAAVVDRAARIPLAHAELYGATSGGMRIDDPGSDLAMAAALASSASGVVAPARTAFIGEVSLTGQVRPVSGIQYRISAAKACGISTVFAPEKASHSDLCVVPVGHVRDALRWVREHETAPSDAQRAKRKEMSAVT